MSLGQLAAQQLDGFRNFKLIPLVVAWSGGTPSVVQNPTNEVVSLTDNGTGDLSITLSSAGVAPLIAVGCGLQDSDTAANILQIKSASSSVLRIIVFQGDDASANTSSAPVDPTRVHLLIMKQVQA